MNTAAEARPAGPPPPRRAPDPSGPGVPPPDRVSRQPFEDAVRQILAEIGEDPARPGLADTPSRGYRMYAELTPGYREDPDRLLNGAVFDVDYSEMVVGKDIPFPPPCEHHLLPFVG